MQGYVCVKPTIWRVFQNESNTVITKQISHLSSMRLMLGEESKTNCKLSIIYVIFKHIMKQKHPTNRAGELFGKKQIQNDESGDNRKNCDNQQKRANETRAHCRLRFSVPFARSSVSRLLTFAPLLPLDCSISLQQQTAREMCVFWSNLTSTETMAHTTANICPVF